MLRLALPSRGRLEDPTLAFLAGCGLAVERRNTRQYQADIPALRNAQVMFQRAADITEKVESGVAHLGITGLDQYYEARQDDGDCLVLMEDLGYGHCELVAAVPESWIDVSSIADLVELAAEFKERGRELRIATSFPNLTRRFCYRKELHYFTLLESTGAIEAAPAMGFADLITDISESGTSLRENRLKTLRDGTILKAQACLIGNRRALREDPERLRTTKHILELMEARLRARRFRSVTANIRGASAEAVAEHVLRRPEIAGIQGPTVAKVYSHRSSEQDWYAVTVVVRSENVLTAVEHLREMGGSGVTVLSPDYVFEERSVAYEQLLVALNLAGEPRDTLSTRA
ncbi:MAG: ATP phosphoribosyltransferase [Chloroflexi bacterium]|nr:ATP phosphoribosyltransferase [Chloroflexota bacterium]